MFYQVTRRHKIEVIPPASRRVSSKSFLCFYISHKFVTASRFFDSPLMLFLRCIVLGGPLLFGILFPLREFPDRS